MYHFFVEKEQVGEQLVTITGPDVNHIKNVLRMKPGEVIGVSERGGRALLCEIESLSGEAVAARIVSEGEGVELPVQVYLYQGLPKGDKLELVIQKAVELGVYRVIPVATRRSIVKLDKKKEESRVRRWNAISETAAKQSGRGMIPEVSGVVSFKEALEQTKDFEIKLIPYENARGMARTRELLDSVRPGDRVAVFIGPEGGFEEEEVAMAVEAGAEPVTLGQRILRTETAGLAMLAALGFWMEE